MMVLPSDAGLPLIALAAIGLLYARVRRLRDRLEQVASAEHELRGAATALALLSERPAGDREAIAVQLDRLCAGLADLELARGGRRTGVGSAPVDLQAFLAASLAPFRSVVSAAVPPQPLLLRADRGRLAQALGNLIANAVEHGTGPAELRTRSTSSGVRVELRNRCGAGRPPGTGRGRGIAIAARATREMGGRLDVSVEGDEVVAALDLPVRRAA